MLLLSGLKKVRAFEISIFSLLMLFYVGCCGLYVIKASVLFPVLAFIALMLSLFIFKSRYRILSLIFASSFASLLVLDGYSIGSLYSWSLIFYIIIIFVERVLNYRNNPLSKYEIKLLISFVLLSLYVIGINFLSRDIGGFKKAISVIAYFGALVFANFDKKSKKDPYLMLVTFSVGIILSNAVCIGFIYVLKPYTQEYLRRFVGEDFLKHYLANNDSFRYPSLYGDPNYNGCFILFASCMIILYFLKSKKHFDILLAVLFFVMQPLGMLGSSKTYLLLLLVMLIFFSIVPFKKQEVFKILPFVLLGVLVIFLCGGPFINNILLRFFNIDARTGFLSAMTTYRSDIYVTYLNYFIAHPVHMFFGTGLTNTIIEGYRNGPHALILGTIWTYGIIGSIFEIYFISLISFNKMKRNGLLAYSPIISVLLYGLAINLVNNEIILFGLFVYNSIISMDDYFVKKLDIDTTISLFTLERKKKHYETIKI